LININVLKVVCDGFSGVYTIETLEQMLHPRNRGGKFFSVCAIINGRKGRLRGKRAGKGQLLQQLRGDRRLWMGSLI